MSEAGERLIQSAKEAAQMAKEYARRTHDEELVEQVAIEFADCHGQTWSRLSHQDKHAWRNEVRMVLETAYPLITRKAKEELLKQMMEPSEAMEEAMARAAREDCEHRGIDNVPATAHTIFRAMLLTFATEQGLNIEKGEG